jgi:hypothetical protein
MRGLRVYVDPKKPDPWCGGTVFYTRRAGGPYYRWRYEDLRGEWQCSRMHVCDLTLTALVLAPWKRIPDALKRSLDEHYID